MITIRPAAERGAANLGWLDTRHTFSFGNYYDPAHMGFASLRVINEDKVLPGQGFPTHGHQDMEIVTYILEGELEHRDSIGNGSIIRPGDVQRMSAGSGIRHSEYNPSSENPVHLLQIWLLPETTGLAPSYEQTHFSQSDRQGQLRLIGSRDGREGSVTIHQDVSLYVARLTAEEKVQYPGQDPGPDPGQAGEGDRKIWVQVARGMITLNGQTLYAGDGAGISQAQQLELVGQSDHAEFLLFDMAA